MTPPGSWNPLPEHPARVLATALCGVIDACIQRNAMGFMAATSTPARDVQTCSV
jgi:hypothetical protein